MQPADYIVPSRLESRQVEVAYSYATFCVIYRCRNSLLVKRRMILPVGASWAELSVLFADNAPSHETLDVVSYYRIG